MGNPLSSPVRILSCIAVVLLALVTGCTDDSPPEPTALATGEPMDLNVLVYNIEYEGGPETDAVIKDIGADVVGVLESYDRLPEIAANTGYEYYNVGLQLLSKYPIHEPSGADGLYALIEVQPGYSVAFFNTHLDYVKYGPTQVVNGMSVEDAIASENEIRTSSLQIQMPQMEALAEQGYPVFLTGDFNEPSSLDYTQETVGTRDGITEPIAWPVSEALFDIGFRDTYREIYPDPVKVPGLTKDNPDFREGGVGDRIDYVYAGGPSTTLDSKLVGERGGADVDLEYMPWTSDHRAVLSTVNVTPVALPTTVSLATRMLTEGDSLNAYVNAPGTSDNTVAVIPDGGDPAAPAATAEGIAAVDQVSFDTKNLEPGGYQIVLNDSGGDQIATNEFWLRSKEADAIVTTDKSEYAVGEPIIVSWDDGPANRWDWIGVFEASADNPDTDDYLLWGYTGGHDSGALPPTVAGSLTIGPDSQGKPWPLPPGDYVVHYLLADQYDSAGTATFTVHG